MVEVTVLNSIGELYNAINEKKAQGYTESEMSVITKNKLHLNDLHDSEISLIATSGSFSDRTSKLLTGEDGEHAVLSRYNFNPDEVENYKQQILDKKLLLVVNPDTTSHKEVEKHNVAYKEVDITHYAEESKGPKS
ncbi:general stress protein [Staphylococcus simiae]|uniref:general stress protein n=1 Tax=Staphylococcus simiae TaxID=308354 RepID=UPI001A974D7B|nr:general stress protein [Staphylococcus simiae]MBO1199316.1 general stress protein [Staphylococcus simiae]MBO1201549.1 general stress protein [Staphylococcus simiae]MBO1203704.1 general stress protein [Staphylococcus simiae]MBO1211331.1 general stress protein [Staphylococcus simiae]MBO1229930.1 general stress protein [Staphylococcus simiae]